MNIALILSGGTGNRVGADIPKQYIEVQGRMIITYCLETLACHNNIDAIQIVANEEWQQSITESMNKIAVAVPLDEQGQFEDNAFSKVLKKLRGYSKPGETRQLSILNGLRDVIKYADGDDIVLIHDAARPFVSNQMISDCLNAMNDCDGVMPVLPMKDTVYRSMNGRMITELLDRSTIFAGQAPEGFRLGKYMSANEMLLPDKILTINGSSEPAVMAGMNVKMIPGDEGNFKITTKEDLVRFEEIMMKEVK